MSYGARSFAVSVTRPPTPVVRLPQPRRARVVMGSPVDHPPRPRAARPLRPGAILRRVAAEHHVTVAHIKGRSHGRPVVLARHEAMVAVAKLMPSWSVTRIAQFFDRDHTTVLHAFKKAGFVHGRAPIERLPDDVHAARRARTAEWRRRRAEGDEGLNGNALLTAEAVRAIRAAPRERHWAKTLAREYGVAVKTIWDARFRRTWKRLP